DRRGSRGARAASAPRCRAPSGGAPMRQYVRPSFPTALVALAGALAGAGGVPAGPAAGPDGSGAERVFQGHTDGVIAVALSPDGKRALSGAVCYGPRDTVARLWATATGKEVQRLEGHTPGAYAVASAPHGRPGAPGH